MKIFLIQSEGYGDYKVPRMDYGNVVINAIRYKNWLGRHADYTIVLDDKSMFSNTDLMKRIEANIHSWIPVGDVNFAVSFYSKFGIDVKPLNIPESLFGITNRMCGYTTNLAFIHGKCMVKDKNIIKHPDNGVYDLPDNRVGDFFFTEFVDKILSEWRCFVLDRQLIDIRRYSGDYTAYPLRSYIDNIISRYDEKRCYTLDLAVDIKHNTHIVEMHEFFSCGLYGFDDYIQLLKMLVVAHTDIVQSHFRIQK